MDERLRLNIDKYKSINWDSLTREDSFAEGKNFRSQKKLFEQAKSIFDILLENIDIISNSLPVGVLQQISSQMDQFFGLIQRVSGYSDTNKHGEVVEDIKRTCFDVQESLLKYVEYVKPSDVQGKIKKELEELVRVKDEVERAVKERLKVLDQGIEKTSEGKREISGVEAANFFEEQAARHRNNAEGNGRVLFPRECSDRKLWEGLREILPFKIVSSEGWLESRRISHFLIVGLILIVVDLYISTFFSLDIEKWKSIWDVRMSVLLVALLTILYTGLYFATKNYEREKDLEYRNKLRANIANTWLTFSAGQGDVVRDIATKEAAKTLFSDMVLSDGKKSKESQSVSISIPQNIGKSLNDQ